MGIWKMLMRMRDNEQHEFQMKYFSFGHEVKPLFQSANKYFGYGYITLRMSKWQKWRWKFFCVFIKKYMGVLYPTKNLIYIATKAVK